jgi:hypothetical protein
MVHGNSYATQFFIPILMTQSHSLAECWPAALQHICVVWLEGLILCISSDMPGHIKVPQQCTSTAAHSYSDVYAKAGQHCCPC